MKTTVEIADPLFHEARLIAERDGETMRALIEQGLRTVIAERQAKSSRFKLRDASVGVGGLQPEFQDASWDRVRDAIYEGRGS